MHDDRKDKVLELLHDFWYTEESVFEDLKEIFGRSVTHSDIHAMSEPDRDKVERYLIDRLEDW